MQTKTIPLKDVKDALMFAKVRIYSRGHETSGKPIARWAAYTQNPIYDISCRQALRGHKPSPQVRSCGYFLARGDMKHLLEKVRMHGLPEVRKTFGAGMRALQAEFADGVMR